MIDIQEIKCKNCGAGLKVFPSINRAFCEHCGSNYYLEYPISAGRSFPSDNPKSIRIVRDECDYTREFTIPEIMDIRFREQSTDYIQHQVMPMLTEQMCFISAVSYILKKSYSIEDLAIRFTRYLDLFTDNYQVRLFSSNNNKSNKSYLDKVNQTRYDFLCNVRDVLGRLGIKYTEKVASVKPAKEHYIHADSYDTHVFGLEFPLIKPSRFKKRFPNVYEKYMQVKDYEIINTFASIVISDINQIKRYVHSDVRVFFDVNSRGIRWSLKRGIIEGYLIGKRIDFHEYKMDYIEDNTVLQAVRVAIIEKVLKGTAYNGKNMLDLDKVFYSVYDVPDHDPEIGFVLRYLDSSVKEYNKW